MPDLPQVTVSPAHRFGRPAMNGISTEAIADHYWCDDPVEADYNLSRHELLVALWFEAVHGQPRFRRRWKTWGKQVGQVLWDPSKVDVTAVDLPPVRDPEPLAGSDDPSTLKRVES